MKQIWNAKNINTLKVKPERETRGIHVISWGDGSIRLSLWVIHDILDILGVSDVLQRQ